MQRIRTLAVQSANATNSESDRAALDAEVQQRLAEITRISQQTTFNGRHVLDGTFGSAAFQIGANVGETISVDLSQGAGAKDVGQIAQSLTGDISSKFASAAGLTLAAGDLTVDGTSVAANTYTSAQDLADAINAAIGGGSTAASVSTAGELTVTNSTGAAIVFAGDAAAGLGLGSVNAAGSTTTVTPTELDSTGLAAAFTAGSGSLVVATGDILIGGTDIAAAGATYANIGELADAINAAAATAGYDGATDFATVNGGEITFSNDSAAAVAITGAEATNLGLPASLAAGTSSTTTTNTVVDSTGVNAAVTAAAGTDLVLGANELTINNEDMAGTYKDAQSLVDAINAKGISGVSAYYDSDTKSIHLNSQEALTVDGTKAGTGELGFSNAGGGPIAVGSDLAHSDVKSVAGANDTISKIDAALGKISSMRSDLGAVQNRFDSTIANLQTISQNLSSSRSQIQDADFAAETANMSSANILQQAGVSVLAQANATTQSVLKLLQ